MFNGRNSQYLLCFNIKVKFIRFLTLLVVHSTNIVIQENMEWLNALSVLITLEILNPLSFVIAVFKLKKDGG